LPIPKISLSEEGQKKLVSRLKEMIEAGEEFHSNWESLHSIYWQQYFTEPDSEVKMFPWRGASNLYLPLGRVIQDGIMSQLHDAMFGSDPLVKVRASKSSRVQQSDVLSMFYGDYVFKKVINLRRLGNDWNFLTCLDGTSVIRPRWKRETILKRQISAEMKPIYGESDQTLMGAPMPSITGVQEETSEEAYLSKVDQPVLELMDMSRLYVAPDTIGTLQYPDCPWYFYVTDLTWDELVSRRRGGYANIDEELKVRMARRSPQETERLRRANEDLSEGTVLFTTPVYEFHMRLVLPCEYYDENGEKQTQDFMDENGYEEECIVTYLKDTEKISRIVPLSRVMPNGKRPDVVCKYNSIPHRFYGQGIQSKMRHLNAMLNAGANQMVDYGTLQNLPFYFYVPHLAQMPDLTSLTPGQGVPIGDTRGIQFPRMNGDQGFWLNTMQMIQGWAERDGNISDQMTGRLPEKAANKTARGMMLVQQMANKSFRRVAALMAESYTEALYAVHELYKRHAPPELVFRVTDEQGANFEDIRMSRRELEQDIDFEMVLNPDRESEQQTAQALFQLVMSIPYVNQNPVAVRAAAKHLYDSIGTGQGRRNFNEIWPEQMTQQILMAQQRSAMMQRGMPPQPGAPQQPQGRPMPRPQAQTPPPMRNDMSGDDIGVAL
jgi:hypothetical protein